MPCRFDYGPLQGTFIVYSQAGVHQTKKEVEVLKKDAFEHACLHQELEHLQEAFCRLGLLV